MSKRYEWINGETYCDSDRMYDNETGNKTQPVYVADLLNEQDQKIKELEHRLANCIEPKFKQYQQVFYIANGHIISKWSYECECQDGIIISRYFLSKDEIVYHKKSKDLVFATEEEAKKHLEVLKNG